MKCPSCGKELERMKRQVGTTESGDPIFNEYAVCRDCKKQWNLDRQRAGENSCKKKKRLNRQKQSQSIKLKAKSLSDLLNHPYPRRVQQKKTRLPKKPPVKRPAAGSDAEKVKEAEKKAEAKPAKKTQTDRRRRKTCTSEGFKTDQ